MVYNSVGPLRLLLAAEADPEAVAGLMDHSEDRRRADPRGWATGPGMITGWVGKETVKWWRLF